MQVLVPSSLPSPLCVLLDQRELFGRECMVPAIQKGDLKFRNFQILKAK